MNTRFKHASAAIENYSSFRPMRITQHLVLVCILVASSTSCSSKQEPFTAMRVQRWQEIISKGLPPGSSVEDSKKFFTSQGADAHFVTKESTLYAHQNIEPEPRSLLPFGLIKSFEIRCSFSKSGKLTQCLVEASTKRWQK